MTNASLASEPVSTSPWVDGKRFLWLLSPFVPVIGLIVLGLYQWSDTGLLLWGVFILLYGIIPLLDWLVGVDRTNPPESAVAHLENDLYYRAIVYAYIPTQYLVTIWGGWLAVNYDLSVIGLIGLIFSVGTINGIAINTAHELG
ncbi:MAG: alkane 1-monooxygenase, partial [Burkholderiales bacterium]